MARPGLVESGDGVASPYTWRSFLAPRVHSPTAWGTSILVLAGAERGGKVLRSGGEGPAPAARPQPLESGDRAASPYRWGSFLAPRVLPRASWGTSNHGVPRGGAWGEVPAVRSRGLGFVGVSV